MDPDQNLKEIRELVEALPGHSTEDAERLCELFEALDGWMRSGGFLPREWQDSRAAVSTSLRSFYRIIEENKALHAQVTAVQENNTKLVGQRRQLKELLLSAYEQCQTCPECEGKSHHEQDCTLMEALELT